MSFPTHRAFDAAHRWMPFKEIFQMSQQRDMLVIKPWVDGKQTVCTCMYVATMWWYQVIKLPSVCAFLWLTFCKCCLTVRYGALFWDYLWWDDFIAYYCAFLWVYIMVTAVWYMIIPSHILVIFASVDNHCCCCESNYDFTVNLLQIQTMQLLFVMIKPMKPSRQQDSVFLCAFLQA